MSRTAGRTFVNVVLAIVLVLIIAAIAIPNFLESDALAHLHKHQKQLRKIAAAMEAYRADWGTYPVSEKDSPLAGHGTGNEVDQRLLTTPNAYLEAIIPDGCRMRENEHNDRKQSENYPIYAVAYVNAAPSFTAYPRTAWMTWGIGNDGRSNTDGYRSLNSVIANEASTSPSLTAGIRYDPTNGPEEVGDIYQFGGDAEIKN